jgi:hypothetical protein
MLIPSLQGLSPPAQLASAVKKLETCKMHLLWHRLVATKKPENPKTEHELHS